MALAALRFKQSNVPRQQGEQARLKVVQGPDYGAVYVLIGAKASVGRGEENDIMISDLKASRRHAEFAAGPGGWIVRDAGSANGILYNGKAVKTASLKMGDTVTLGETTLEFISSEAGTMMLVAPPKSITQVQSEQAAFAAQKAKVNALGGYAAGAAAGGPASGGIFKNKAVVLGAVGLAVVMFMLPSEKPEPKNKTKKDGKDSARDLASYLPGAEEAMHNATAKQFFQAGFREYQAHNYLRAKTMFDNVLQVAPGHPLATLYIENCNKAIETEVDSELKNGKKAMVAGKLKEARGHFEAVMRLLNRDQSNPAFVEARDQLEKTIKEIKGDG